MIRAFYHSLVRSFVLQHRWLALGVALSTVIVVAALLAAQSALGLGHSTKAAGGGGGGGCAGVAAAVCHFKGNTAEARFTATSPDGCVQTTFSLTVSEDVTMTPPDPRVSGATAFAELTAFNECTENYVFFIDGFASAVSFQATQVTLARLEATIAGDDGSGTTVPITVDLTWKGIGGTAKTVQDTSFKSPVEQDRTRFDAISRDAQVSGTIAAQDTVYTSSTSGGISVTMTGDLFSVTEGSWEHSRS